MAKQKLEMHSYIHTCQKEKANCMMSLVWRLLLQLGFQYRHNSKRFIIDFIFYSTKYKYTKYKLYYFEKYQVFYILNIISKENNFL